MIVDITALNFQAANRDAFMSVKQDLLLAFVECVDRNGARLARNRFQVTVPLPPWLKTAVALICVKSPQGHVLSHDI